MKSIWKTVIPILIAGTTACVFAPTGSASEPLTIVDFPTAGLYGRGEYGISIDVYSQGGLLVGLGVGFARFLSFGITYGGVNVIGSGDPKMNPRPEVNIRGRILEEDLVMPAVAIGFDSQGYGKYAKYYGRDSSDFDQRYLVKSRGLYAVASKNWDLAGPFSLHGGISYSLENKKDHDATIFFGVIKSLAGVIDLSAEFDFASNDNEGPISIVDRRAYLNASIAWYMSENLRLALEVRDLAAKGRSDLDDARKWNRGLSISYGGTL